MSYRNQHPSTAEVGFDEFCGCYWCMIRIKLRGGTLIMCIPQIILVQVMHDSPDAEDAGILFSFLWKGGGGAQLCFSCELCFHCIVHVVES